MPILIVLGLWLEPPSFLISLRRQTSADLLVKLVILLLTVTGAVLGNLASGARLELLLHLVGLLATA